MAWYFPEKYHIYSVTFACVLMGDLSSENRLSCEVDRAITACLLGATRGPRAGDQCPHRVRWDAVSSHRGLWTQSRADRHFH